MRNVYLATLFAFVAAAAALPVTASDGLAPALVQRAVDSVEVIGAPELLTRGLFDGKDKKQQKANQGSDQSKWSDDRKDRERSYQLSKAREEKHYGTIPIANDTGEGSHQYKRKGQK